MPIVSTISAPWSFIQWAVTGIATLLVSALAFVWRLAIRVDRFESSFATQTRVWEANSSATEAAMLRLAERLAQAHDDHFRIRETMGTLPTRSDLRDLEDRVIEQLAALAARLDRSFEKREN
jgi:hypothetical protein